MAISLGVVSVTILLLCFTHVAAQISYFWPGQHAGSYGGKIPSYQGYYFFGQRKSSCAAQVNVFGLQFGQDMDPDIHYAFAGTGGPAQLAGQLTGYMNVFLNASDGFDSGFNISIYSPWYLDLKLAPNYERIAGGTVAAKGFHRGAAAFAIDPGTTSNILPGYISFGFFSKIAGELRSNDSDLLQLYLLPKSVNVDGFECTIVGGCTDWQGYVVPCQG